MLKCEGLPMIEDLIAKSSRDPDCFQRFAEDFQLCRGVDVLWDKTMDKYQARGEHTWLYELVDLGDWLSIAAYQLDESLRCEHELGEYRPLV